MDVKEKLVEIIQNSVGGCARHWAEIIADGLIAHGVTVQEWVSVKDRVPEKQQQYLCICNIDGHTEYSFYMILDYYIVDEKPHFQHECEHGLNVTHWMSLPQPPKGE